MTYDEFKKVADGIWHIGATVALLVGGIWTLMTFSTLREQEKADLQMRRLRMEPAVSLEVSATSLSEPLTAGHVLDIKTTVKNNGSDAETIAIGTDIPPVRVSKVQFGSNGELTGTDAARAGLYVSGLTSPVPAGGIFIMPGETRQWTTPVILKDPGLYLVLVTLHRPLPDQTRAKETGMPSDTGAVWSAGTLVTVLANPSLHRTRRLAPVSLR